MQSLFTKSRNRLLLNKEAVVNCFCSSSDFLTKDPYRILGVSPLASQEKIKQAYRELALKYHPDRNSSFDAQDKIAEINDAYEILSDEQKKMELDKVTDIFDDSLSKKGSQKYDYYSAFGNFWYTNSESRSKTSKETEDEIFVDFNEYFGFNRTEKNKKIPENIKMDLNLTLLEAAYGLQKIIPILRKVICSSCNGSRCQPKTGPSKCYTCGGKGKINYRNGPQHQHVLCHKCKGYGATIRFPCTSCKGEGTVERADSVQIDIPLGIENNEIRRFHNKGHQNDEGMVGDLIIRFQVENDNYFTRKNMHVYTNQKIKYWDAVLGCHHEIQTLYGKKNVEFPPGIQNKQEVVLKGFGFKKIEKASNANVIKQGDHYIVIELEVPKLESDSMKEVIDKLDVLEKDRNTERVFTYYYLQKNKENKEPEEEKKEANRATVNEMKNELKEKAVEKNNQNSNFLKKFWSML